MFLEKLLSNIWALCHLEPPAIYIESIGSIEGGFKSGITEIEQNSYFHVLENFESNTLMCQETIL